jgi:hypothetical protein
MTVDPVHVESIARLARRVGSGVDATEHADIAETAWTEFLDPLRDGGGVVLEPLDERRRREVAIDDVALAESPFPTQHGLDSGTINPTTFTNGLVVDVSQAAMASVPSDTELHRARTIVMTVHANDPAVDVSEADWHLDDHGYARERVIQVPRVDRFEQTVVHALALYLAESRHAHAQFDLVDDLLVLDGPLYPTGLLTWAQRDPELRGLLTEAARPREVLDNYRRLVERAVTNDLAIVGFVKNSASKAITGVLREHLGAPWVDDDAFFRALLEQRTDDGRGDGGPSGREGRVTDRLTFTNWFRSRVGTDGLIAADREPTVVPTDAEAPERDAHEGNETESTNENQDDGPVLPTTDYEVTFFVVYDPRADLVFRVEAPYGLTKDPATREAITTQVLRDVAGERGPPPAVRKADALARIDRDGKRTLRERIERAFETEERSTYDDTRWGLQVE